MGHRIGFLGAGNMATALAHGFVKAGLADGADLAIYDIVAEKSAQLAAAAGAKPAGSVAETLKRAETIVLAVKPQNAAELLPEVAPGAEPRHLFISILAGTPTRAIETRIGGSPRVVRVMPNTPALVAEGASALARGRWATAADLDTALELFRSVGIAVAVQEEQLDAVTGLSGSGPAYFFYLMEALIEGGCAAGLDRETATALTIQTALGAGKLARSSADGPAALREKVTSKGGTTAAGLAALREGGFEGLVKRCVAAAVARSKELGKAAG
ncbi:MAG: pyrroline-5-carboxylate reductase [Candidatus Sumerlaeota bacterium]|nr:pyrroline-5-carboxylate reductase [Candidatus Sumerlaeota bacterium]